MSTGAFTLADVDKPKGQFTSADVDSTPPNTGWSDAYKRAGSAIVSGANAVAAKVLGAVSLPQGFSDISDWARHLTGQAEDSKPFWNDIHEAAKSPTQENLVKAVPIVGPAAVAASQDVKNKKYGEAAWDVVQPTVSAAVGGAVTGEATAGLAARKAAAADAAAAKAAQPSLTAASKLNQAIPATKSTPYTPQDYQTARPYLEAEHSGKGGVQEVRDSADSAISKIEDHVSNYIAQVPQDPITTNVKQDVAKVLATNPRGQQFVTAGMKELDGLKLDNPTITEADAIRRQLNAENKAVLKKNSYDVATARAADPGFAAREAAAESLRNGIYDQLEARGIEGVRELRQDEGSIIKIRNAAQNQLYNGERTVAGSGETSGLRRLGQAAARTAGTLVGAHVGGPFGAVAGSAAGESVGEAFTTPPQTRNALADQSFSAKVARPVEYPQVNLRAIPEKAEPVGTQGSFRTGTPGPLFQTNQSTLFENMTPQEKANIQARRMNPSQKVLDDPNATVAEKAEAREEMNRLSNVPPPVKLTNAVPAQIGPTSPLIRLAAPKAPTESDFAYRARNQGEEGLPIGGSKNNAAHATTTLEDARRLAPGRESVTGERQEIVKYDLSKLKEGKDFRRIKRPGQPDWIRMLRPLKEADLQVVE